MLTVRKGEVKKKTVAKKDVSNSPNTFDQD